MTKIATPNTALETTFVTEEQTATLVRNVELVLERLDDVAGGACSCVNCCSHSKQRFTSVRNISLPALSLRTR